jgi:peptidoglycan biosynthesis protein MviN/MurJ (putative lipid II flippase)
MYANAVTAPSVFYLVSQGHFRPIGWAAGVNMVTNAGASLLLTLWIGYRGAMLGSVVANVTGSLFLLVWLRLRYQEVWRVSLARPLVSAIACSALGWIFLQTNLTFTGWLGLVLGVGAWALLSLSVSALLRAFDPRIPSVASRASSPAGEGGQPGS